MVRALWCLLVVFGLLAPVGRVGITVVPAEAETHVTAPRAFASAGASRELALPDIDVAAPLVAVAAPRQPITRRVSPKTSTWISSPQTPFVSSRAPPA